MPDAHLVFLPWLRQGMAARVSAADPLTAPLPAQAPLSARIDINGAEGATMPLTLAGPGEVSGIDARQVVRMEPPPGTTDYEANDFAAVEFDNPDLPWMFTPAGADTQGRLRPWLVLVVVKQHDGVVLRPPRSEALPVLDIAPPARPADELPDLADAWAWAHAQLAAAADADVHALRQLIATQPDRCVSRLVCPRLLEPFTRYLACVVPAFEAGRLGGLNLPISGRHKTQLAPAWRSGAQAPAQIALPVYHHWEFATAAREDFESLVRKLVPRDLAGLVGRRPMDLNQPGFPVADAPLPALPLEGALQPKGAPRIDWPGPQSPGSQAWQALLQDIVNSAALPAAGSGDPLVGPPIYGRWVAERSQIGAAPPTWVDDLNLDPRERVAAALGTRVVQDGQEALVAEAWQQAGELDRVNQRLRQLQLSLVVGTRLHARHVQALGNDDAALWRLAAPAQARIVWQPATAQAGAQSLRSFVASRRTPKALFSAPLRRLTRPFGEVNRRARTAIVQAAPAAAARSRTALSSFAVGTLNLFSTQMFTMVLALPPTRGLVSFDAVTRRLPAAQAPRAYVAANDLAVANTPQRPDFRIVLPSVLVGVAAPVAPPLIATRAARLPPIGTEPPEPPEPPPPPPPRPPIPPRVDSPDAKVFREAARRHLAQVNPATAIIIGTVVRPALDVVAARATLVQRLDPAPVLHSRMQAALVLAEEAPPEIAPLGYTPHYSQPMSEPLAALSQDWLLPGLDQVPADTLALLQPNPRFIEAYMAGLNVEMARELLWRDYPLADPRATFFRRFWRGAQAGGDIAAMADWGTSRLGHNAPAGTPAEQSVLLVRSTLFRRYPGAVVYAVPALRGVHGRKPDVAAAHEQPLFRGALQPDVTFFGFAIDPDEAVADPGWYFVIEQQPTEPRFGFDVDIQFGAASHVPLAAPPAGLVLPPGTRWAFNAAHMAQIVRQQPMRIAIHASQLLGRRPPLEPR